MRIAIRDNADTRNIAFFDNNAGIKYHEAKLNIYLQGSAAVLNLKYYSYDYDKIQSGHRLAFVYRAKEYWMTITNVEKDGLEITLTALGASLDANKGEVGEYKASRAMSIIEYWQTFDTDNNFEIGINEVAEKRITAEWSGQETMLARLFSLAEKFDAELEFKTELNRDYSLKRQVVNIYRQGNLGERKVGHPIVVGKDVKSVTFCTHINSYYTQVTATGKDGLTISGLTKNVYDDKGELLYFTNGDSIFAPQARQRIAGLTNRNELQGYIKKNLGSTEYESKENLYAYLLSQIKKLSTPEVEYELEGFVDAEIGDTRLIKDSINYRPTLYLEARIISQEYDLINPANNKTEFSNVVRKYSQVNEKLLVIIQNMIDKASNYEVAIQTDSTSLPIIGGTPRSFSAVVRLNGKGVDATKLYFKWRLNNHDILAGQFDGYGKQVLNIYKDSNDITVNTDNILTVSIYENEVYKGSAQLVLKWQKTHIAYADNISGSKGFTTEETDNKEYQGFYTGHGDENDPNAYTWFKVKGEHLHVAYADNISGSQGFTFEYPVGKIPAYKGTYTDYSTIASNNPAMYKWEINPDILKPQMDELSKELESAKQELSANQQLINQTIQDADAMERYLNNTVVDFNKQLSDMLTNVNKSIKDEADKLTLSFTGQIGDLRTITTNLTAGVAGISGEISDIQTGVGGIKSDLNWLKDSFAVRYLTSAGTILSQLNVNPEGVYIDGKLIHLTGKSLIDQAVIKTAHIADAQITNAKISNLAITTAKIADAAVTNAKIHDLSAEKITAGYIKSARIEAGSITADKIDVSSLSALTANLGEITTGKIKNSNGNFEINATNGTISSSYGGNSVYISSGELEMEKDGNNVSMDFKGLVVSNGYTYVRLQPEVIDVGGSIYADGYFRNATTYVDFEKIVKSEAYGDSKVLDLELLGSSSNPYLHIGTSGGNYGVTAWTSDERLKENIFRISDNEALEKINQVDVYQFDWKKSKSHVDYGFVAQRLENTFPEAVFDVSGTLNINVSGIVPPMLAAIKALSTKLSYIESIINNIKLGEINNGIASN